MKRFRFFRRAARNTGAPFQRDRERLKNAMPGETGALTALRLGMLV